MFKLAIASCQASPGEAGQQPPQRRDPLRADRERDLLVMGGPGQLPGEVPGISAQSPARVHQITAAADLDELDAALGELRAAGWPAPEDPGGDDDAELDGRDLICDRLLDEVGWLRQCADWLNCLHISEYSPAVNLRPDGDHPDRALVVVDLPRVAAIVQRIAADVDELARARRVADLDAAAALPDRRAERRRRVAEPDLDLREFCRRSGLPRSERSRDLFAAEGHRRGESGVRSYEAYNPFRAAAW